MKKINYASINFIESDTYVGSEEEISVAGLNNSDEEYIVITKENWDYIQEQLYRLNSLEY